MRTRTNKFLANLAASDLMVCVVDMPLSLVTLNNGDFPYGDFMCNFNAFTVGMGTMTSLHLLMYMR